MRNRLTGLLLLAAFATSAMAAEPLPRKAPDFAIQTAPEKYIWINQYPGKTLICAFILTYCQHCQKTTGILNGIQRDYAPKGLQILASAIEDMSSLHIAEFESKFKPQFPVGYNERGYLMKFLGLPENDNLMMPTLVFIDRNGIMRSIIQGDDAAFSGDQDKNLRDILDRVIKEGQTTSQPPARISRKK